MPRLGLPSATSPKEHGEVRGDIAALSARFDAYTGGQRSMIRVDLHHDDEEN